MEINFKVEGIFGLNPTTGVDFSRSFYQKIQADYGRVNKNVSVKSSSLNTQFAPITGGITYYESPGWFEGIFATSPYHRNTAPTQTKTTTELRFVKPVSSNSALRNTVVVEYEGALSSLSGSIQKNKKALKITSKIGRLSGDIDKLTFKYSGGPLVDSKGVTFKSDKLEASATIAVTIEGSRDKSSALRPHKEWISASSLGTEGILAMGAKGFDYLTRSNDIINGSDYSDNIEAGNGNDLITGNGGLDRLSGGRGKDIFIYKNVADSGVSSGSRDIVTDFNGKEGDRIDLSSLDGYRNISFFKRGFIYLGTKDFEKSTQDIQIRFANEVLQVDHNRDGFADMEIQLLGVKTFSADHLIL